ncbi:MAG: ABC transporter ATP-binding protein/permease, partial [Kangiellaceae bacterium]|nr:ABC transporter ATP-binding protein/permease [Kangiellaceae bacterium]
LIIVLGSLSFLLIILGNLVNALDVWIATKFGFQKERQLSQKLLANYFRADELEFSKKKVSERTKTIISDIDRVILDTLFSMLEMLSGILLAIFIFALLVLVNLYAALFISAAIVSVYWLVYFFASKKLDRLGLEFAELETDLYSEVLQSLKLRKEIKLDNLQSSFLASFGQSFNRVMNNRLSYEFISLVPQRIIEVVAYGSILVIATVFTINYGENASAITLIGVYAFAAYRLMPAVSDIFDSFEQIQFGSAILKRLIAELRQEPEDEGSCDEIKLESELKLDSIDFAFATRKEKIFDRLSIHFKLNQFNCILGKTGCGKSTLLNILAGIYQPQGGKILVGDTNVSLYHNANWYQQIAYIPTQINLIDATIAENIALGIKADQIDQGKLKSVIKQSTLDIDLTALEAGANTRIGAEGISLSNGQTQKLGIARALYSSPQLLLVDEGSDALDLASEEKLLVNLKSDSQLTVIFVSHRPSVWQFADHLLDLEKYLGMNSE